MLEEADPLHSFVEHITKAANDCIPRATAIPKKSNPWSNEECREAGNERVDQLEKETLDQDIDPLASVHYADMKPLVNSGM